MGKPNLYIAFYGKDGTAVKYGPYFSARIDGFDVCGREWVCYEVQDENKQFNRITVPYYATLLAVI